MADSHTSWEWDEDLQKHKCYSWSEKKWIYHEAQPQAPAVPAASSSQGTASSSWEWLSDRQQYRRYSYGQQQWIYSDPQTNTQATTPISASEHKLSTGQGYGSGYGYNHGPNPATMAPYVQTPYAQTPAVGGSVGYGNQSHQTDYTHAPFSSSAPATGGATAYYQTPTVAIVGPELRQGAKEGELIEKINPSYKAQPKAFKPGLVFRILWVEPAGNVPADGRTTFRHPRFKTEVFHTKVRWFVATRSNFDYSCVCLPINTYGGRGVSKPTLIKDHHAIIHTDTDPGPLNDEKPVGSEKGMRASIKVDPRKSNDAMNRKSRLDYSRPTSVEKNIKIWVFGQLAQGYEEILAWHAKDVLHGPNSSVNTKPRYVPVSDTGATGQVTLAAPSQQQASSYSSYVNASYPGSATSSPEDNVHNLAANIGTLSVSDNDNEEYDQ